MNGNYTGSLANYHIIRYRDATGTLQTADQAQVNATITDVYNANNTIYNRRRLRFIKVELIPCYTNVQIMGFDGASEEPLGPAPQVFLLTERDGIDTTPYTTAASGYTVPMLMANPQVKMLKYPRKIKLMMRGTKYPYSPKYETAHSYTQTGAEDPIGSNYNYGQFNKAGTWLSTMFSTSLPNGDALTPHMVLVGVNVPTNLEAQSAYYVKHTFYFEWADRKYQTPA